MDYKILLIMISLFAPACECEFPFSDSTGLDTQFDMSDASTVDVLCLLGDSNAKGLGQASELDSGMIANAMNSYRYNGIGGSSTWAALNPGTNTDGLYGGTDGVFGVETPLAAWYYETFNRPLYIVKTGMGGITIDAAQTGSFHPSSPSTTYASLPNPILAALAESTGLPAAITTYRLLLVWHHGANDANDAGYATAYGANMNTVFTQIETDLGESFDRVIDVKVSALFSLVDIASVNTGKESFVSGLGSRAILIDPGTAQVKDDGTHWSGAGQLEIARSIFISMWYQ